MHNSSPSGKGGGGGGGGSGCEYSHECVVVVCHPVLKILTLFQTKTCNSLR